MCVGDIRVRLYGGFGTLLSFIETVGTNERESVIVEMRTVSGAQMNGLFKIVKGFGHFTSLCQYSAGEVPGSVVVGVCPESVSQGFLGKGGLARFNQDCG